MPPSYTSTHRGTWYTCSRHGELASFFSSRKRTFQFLTQQDLSRSQLGNKLLWIVRMIWSRLNALFPAMVNRTPPYCHYISKNRPKKGHKRPNSPSGAALLSGLGGVEIKICQFVNSIRSFSSPANSQILITTLSSPARSFATLGVGWRKIWIFE